MKVLVLLGPIQAHARTGAEDSFITDMAEKGGIGVSAHHATELEPQTDVGQLGRLGNSSPMGNPRSKTKPRPLSRASTHRSTWGRSAGRSKSLRSTVAGVRPISTARLAASMMAARSLGVKRMHHWEVSRASAASQTAGDLMGWREVIQPVGGPI